ncbi:tetraacyldisaccharide 4'-kinase [Rhizomicrobium palustre]|uniref:Tetraacyldisaccharide 4'-kinase n=1 Tax=Rhizomicrobium palustre TaxID=189966 RepID=A0A846N049_9PROT|nr:tetraacyldisaccharide 4'-kinase [Rhizomicrobium palustre]NIK89314.1 tetraacyldisaccharide 4'-kinase [Rhizomicrobium palustre]
MRAPDFWERNDIFAQIAVDALRPLGMFYALAGVIKAKRAKPHKLRVPVICVGNISVGGTGKTPIAIAVADAVIARGLNPFFLSRGYGGNLKGPLVVSKSHKAHEVGDEPLLLSRKAATVVSRNRAAGAELAVSRGADVVIMDDGHQNFALAKDLSIVVVDGAKGFGNREVLPAGPLREPALTGLARADAVVIAGEGSPDLPGFSGPVLRATIAPLRGQSLVGQRVFAFAGIGRPEKFYTTLTNLGAELVGREDFADHYAYTTQDLERLKAKARAAGATLFTTEKDFVRLSEQDRVDIEALPVSATIEPLPELDRLLDRAVIPV